MKKLFITAAIATIFSVTAFADGGKKTTVETGETNISHSVLNQFNADFSEAANAEWKVTSNCQKVTFTIDAAKYTAFYNLSGEYLGLTQTVDYKVIPASAKTDIAVLYRDYKVGQVIKYNPSGADETVVYFVDVKKDANELLLKVTPDATVSYFKTVK